MAKVLPQYPSPYLVVQERWEDVVNGGHLAVEYVLVCQARTGGGAWSLLQGLPNGLVHHPRQRRGEGEGKREREGERGRGKGREREEETKGERGREREEKVRSAWPVSR